MLDHRIQYVFDGTRWQFGMRIEGVFSAPPADILIFCSHFPCGLEYHNTCVWGALKLW